MEKRTEVSEEQLGNDRRQVHAPLSRDRTQDRCSPSRGIFRRATAGPIFNNILMLQV